MGIVISVVVNFAYILTQPIDSFGCMKCLSAKFTIKKIPTDPWENDYKYFTFSSQNTECFVVWSFGANTSSGWNDDYEKDIHVFSKEGNCQPVYPE